MLPHPARCNPAADRSGCGEGHSHPREQRQREQSSGKQEEELKALRRLLLLLLLLRVPGRDPRPLMPQKRRARVCDRGVSLIHNLADAPSWALGRDDGGDACRFGALHHGATRPITSASRPRKLPMLP